MRNVGALHLRCWVFKTSRTCELLEDSVSLLFVAQAVKEQMPQRKQPTRYLQQRLLT